jgi:hypothetical protein
MKSFKTTDLYLAAYFKVAEVPFIGAEIAEGEHRKSVFFIFTYTSNIGNLKKEYFKGESKVVAIDYTNAIKELKGLIINLRGE